MGVSTVPAEAEVLFDFNKVELKPGAIPTLEAIAGQLRTRRRGPRGGSSAGTSAATARWS